MALNKFKNLPPDFKEQMRHIVSEIGVYQTAKKYHERANMSFDAFYRQLKINFENGKQDQKGKGRIKKELTAEEEKFLTELGQGKVSLADASKLVAAKVFRKMLEYPDDVKFIDFFRTELLKLKQDENRVKETWSKEIIARMFAGHLPPQICPNCGHKLVSDSPGSAGSNQVLNGELIDEDS